MKLFRCICGWSYVIGRKNVYGPIFEDGSATQARMMKRALFVDGYDDCAFHLEHGASHGGRNRA